MSLKPAKWNLKAFPNFQAIFFRHYSVLASFLVFIILFIFFCLQADAFLSVENMVNIGRQIAPTIVVATAMTFVITTGAIDLSVGSIVGISAACLAIFAKNYGPTLALILTLSIALLIGCLNGYMSSFFNLPSFIITLASLTAVRGLALLITQGYSTAIDGGWLLAIGQNKIFGIYDETWIAILVILVGSYFFTQTRFGRYAVAAGSNPEALRRSGVNLKAIQMSVLVLSGLFAGLAGVLVATRLASGSSNSGTGFELEVITAVVLGGTSLMGGRGSVIGSIFGALTLGILGNGLVLLHVDVYWVPISQGIILVIAIFFNNVVVKKFARR